MLAFLCRDAHLPAIGIFDATRKQSHDEKSQERSAYRPYPEDRRRAGDFSASRDRVQAVDHSEAADQWPQPQWSRVSSCDGRKTIEQPNEQMEHA
jgi:hypothetical protein